MQELSTKPLVDGFVFLEGPRWHDGRLWVSDMWDRKVYKVAANGAKELVIEVPERPSGIGFMPDGTPLIASMANRKLYKLIGGKLVPHADLLPYTTGDINDMVVDSKGRAYVGNFGSDLFAGEEVKPADLCLVETDGKVRIVAHELVFPNGAVIKDQGKTLVIGETFANRLAAFDIAHDGSLSKRRVYAELGEGTPDGCCLDQQNGIWVASFGTGEFLRVLDGGEITHRIKTEGDRRAVACVLGGDDGRTLFCLTFDGHLDDIKAMKRAGRIETVRVAAASAGSP